MLGYATRNDIVDDIVDFSSSTMAFNVAHKLRQRYHHCYYLYSVTNIVDVKQGLELN